MEECAEAQNKIYKDTLEEIAFLGIDAAPGDSPDLFLASQLFKAIRLAATAIKAAGDVC